MIQNNNLQNQDHDDEEQQLWEELNFQQSREWEQHQLRQQQQQQPQHSQYVSLHPSYYFNNQNNNNSLYYYHHYYQYQQNLVTTFLRRFIQQTKVELARMGTIVYESANQSYHEQKIKYQNNNSNQQQAFQTFPNHYDDSPYYNMTTTTAAAVRRGYPRQQQQRTQNQQQHRNHNRMPPLAEFGLPRGDVDDDVSSSSSSINASLMYEQQQHHQQHYQPLPQPTRTSVRSNTAFYQPSVVRNIGMGTNQKKVGNEQNRDDDDFIMLNEKLRYNPYYQNHQNQQNHHQNIANLDLYFHSLYMYYYQRGFIPICCQGLVEMITLYCTLFLSIFLFLYVDYHQLLSCHDESSCHPHFSSYIIYNPIFSSSSSSNNNNNNNNNHHSILYKGIVLLYCFIFFTYSLIHVCRFIQKVQDAYHIRYIYENVLGIPSNKLMGGSIDWDHDIVQKLIILQQSGEYRIIINQQRQQQQNHHQQQHYQQPSHHLNQSNQQQQQHFNTTATTMPIQNNRLSQTSPYGSHYDDPAVPTISRPTTMVMNNDADKKSTNDTNNQPLQQKNDNDDGIVGGDVLGGDGGMCTHTNHDSIPSTDPATSVAPIRNSSMKDEPTTNYIYHNNNTHHYNEAAAVPNTTTNNSKDQATSTSTTTTTTSMSDLNALMIANRILRKENFLIALFNKGYLDTRVPFLPSPLQDYPFFCSSIEWCIYFCVLSFMFNHKYELRPAFYMEPKALKRRFQICGIIHLVFLPFLFFFTVLYFSLQNAYDYKSTKNYLGPREWSLPAKWLFREFNELPHLFERRLAPSYEAAIQYLNLFTSSEIVAAIGRILVFLGGSIGIVLLAFAMMNDAILLHVKIADWNLLWYAGVVGAIYSIGKSLIPDSKAQPTSARNLFREMDEALATVSEHTHYLPTTWKGRGWDPITHKTFSNMFQFKAKLFIMEMLSLILSPYILCVSLANCSEAICEYILSIRTNIPGVGDVCGYATFDFDSYADETFEGKTMGGGGGFTIPNRIELRNDPLACSLADSILETGNVDDAIRRYPKPKTRYGKMEKSFLSFKVNHPSWNCSPSGQRVVDRTIEYEKAAMEARIREQEELHREAGIKQFETLRQLEEESRRRTNNNNNNEVLSFNPSNSRNIYMQDSYLQQRPSTEVASVPIQMNPGYIRLDNNDIV